MAQKKIQFRKKRETSEIISDTFIFLKQEIKPLAKIVLIYVLPFIILYSILQVEIQQKFFDSGIMNDQQTLKNMLLNDPGPFYKNVFIIILFNVFVQSLFMAAVYSYIKVYVQKGKGNFSLNEVTSLLFHNSLMVLGAGIVLTLIVAFGLMMFFVPGIYFANTLSLTVMILVFENKGLSHALTRSWRFVNTHWWNTLLLNIIGILIILAVGFIISIPTDIAGYSTSVMKIGKQDITDLPKWFWIMTGINAAISTLLYIIPYIFLAFQYFNIDERSRAMFPSIRE